EKRVEVGLERGIEIIDRAAVVLVAADRLAVENAARARKAAVADAGDILRRVEERRGADVLEEIAGDDVDRRGRVDQRGADARGGHRIGGAITVAALGRNT